MSLVPLKIEGKGSRIQRIELDGHDVTSSCFSITWSADANGITTATLGVYVGDLAVDTEAEAVFDRIDPVKGENERTSFASRFREFVGL